MGWRKRHRLIWGCSLSTVFLMFTLAASTATLLVCGHLLHVQAGNNGLAQKPPLSWRSWNQVTETHTLFFPVFIFCRIRKNPNERCPPVCSNRLAAPHVPLELQASIAINSIVFTSASPLRPRPAPPLPLPHIPTSFLFFSVANVGVCFSRKKVWMVHHGGVYPKCR